MLEWQRDWANRETYDAVMDIVKTHFGAYGIGVEYAYTMVRRAPATDFPEYVMRRVPLQIAFTALAMGTRNAAARKLAIPDLTTTVLTLTITGLAADSSFARVSNPSWLRRSGSVLAMFLGAAIGAVVIRYSISSTLALATAISAGGNGALFRSLRHSRSTDK